MPWPRASRGTLSDSTAFFEGRFDGLEANLDHLSAAVTASYTHHDQRLRALEN